MIIRMMIDETEEEKEEEEQDTKHTYLPNRTRHHRASHRHTRQKGRRVMSKRPHSSRRAEWGPRRTSGHWNYRHPAAPSQLRSTLLLWILERGIIKGRRRIVGGSSEKIRQGSRVVRGKWRNEREK